MCMYSCAHVCERVNIFTPIFTFVLKCLKSGTGFLFTSNNDC